MNTPQNKTKQNKIKKTGTKIKTIVTEFIWETCAAVSVEFIQYQGICILPVLHQLFFFFFFVAYLFPNKVIYENFQGKQNHLSLVS